MEIISCELGVTRIAYTSIVTVDFLQVKQIDEMQSLKIIYEWEKGMDLLCFWLQTVYLAPVLISQVVTLVSEWCLAPGAAEAVLKAMEVCVKHGISSGTYLPPSLGTAGCCCTLTALPWGLGMQSCFCFLTETALPIKYETLDISLWAVMLHALETNTCCSRKSRGSCEYLAVILCWEMEEQKMDKILCIRSDTQTREDGSWVKRKGRETALGTERRTSVAECFWLSFSTMLIRSSPIISILFISSFITVISREHKDWISLENC